MNYKSMIEEARRTGKAGEPAMWASIENVSELLEDLREEHPEKYWHFMRKAHEAMHGKHYNEEFARLDISQMHSTDANGIHHEGMHWTKQDVVAAMQGKPMPAGVTDCDKWVAANAMWHDLNKKFDDGQVIHAAILFFLSDEDWPGQGKIWEYMNCNR